MWHVAIRHDSPGTAESQRGAALLIMMLVMILGSASFLLSKLNEKRSALPDASRAQTELGRIRSALIGHAQLNGGCLPCPSLNPLSGIAPASCSLATRAGYLPWQTLNIGEQDPWSHRLRYLVDPDFAVGCSYTQAGDMIGQTRNSSGALITQSSNLVAIVLSHGINGFGSRDHNGNAVVNPPASHQEEISNLTTSDRGIRRPMDLNPSSNGGPFDDIVLWIDRQTLRDEVNDAIGGLPP